MTKPTANDEARAREIAAITTRASAAYLVTDTGRNRVESMLADLTSLLDFYQQQQSESSKWQSEYESTLKFFGATVKEDGSMSINMPKYHAAHLCEKHRDQEFTQKIERCALCLAEDATISRQRAVGDDSPAARPADEWRPIGEAPKDGTQILVFTHGGEFELSEWFTTEMDEYEPVEGSDLYRKQIRKYHEGWNSNRFSHWRPLPPPPIEEK